MNKFLLFLSILFFADSRLSAKYTDPNQSVEALLPKVQDFDISYSIEPYYDIDVFRLIVVMEFKGEKSGTTKIILPGDYGGGDNLAGIKNLKPLTENTSIYDTDKPEIKIVKYQPNTNVRIYYQVEEVRHGNPELGDHYMTVLKRKYFHFLGETFFIVPDWDSNSRYRFLISWNHLPSTWNTANSFGINEKVQSFSQPLWKFRYSVFTGGDFRIIKREINSYPVYISIKGKWLFSDDQIADMAQKILKEERLFWNDFNFPYFLITIFPIDGSGDQGGTGRTNSYALFLSKDRSLDYRLKRVIAHESFHTWIGEKINFSEPEQLLYWFKEGFSEYYARLMLLRANLITLDDYVTEYNKVLKKYFTSPVRFEKNSRVEKSLQGDLDLLNLPYQRGDIIAHNLNASIKLKTKGRKSLDNLVRDILQRCVNESLVLSTGSLSALIRYYADDETAADILRTLNTGTLLKIDPNALGPCFTMDVDSYKRFWLFGEQYEVPYYRYKYDDLQKEKTCSDWFEEN